MKKISIPTGKQSRQRRSDTARLKKSHCEMVEMCRCRIIFTITVMLAGIPNRQMTAMSRPVRMYQELRSEIRGIPEEEQLLMEVLELPPALIMEEKWR